MQVGIIFTDQFSSGKKQWLFLIGDYPQRAAVERDNRVVEVNFAQACPGYPVRLIFFYNHIDDSRAAGDEIHGLLGQQRTPRPDLPLAQQVAQEFARNVGPPRPLYVHPEGPYRIVLSLRISRAWEEKGAHLQFRDSSRNLSATVTQTPVVVSMLLSPAGE